MDKKQKIKAFSFQGFDVAHYKTTGAYVQAVHAILSKATSDIAHVANKEDFDPEKPFSFDDYPKAKAQLYKTTRELAGKMQALIELGSMNQWLFACQKNDEFITSIFDTTKLSKEHLAKMQDRNLDALHAFQRRKVSGMNLSERVWKYTEQFRGQIEIGLDVGLGEGRSAQQLSRDLRQNLQNPDRLFRRVRDKRGSLHLSKAAKAFHPGTGVYRSSYKNAMRLARSEINMAYRESDHLRWQQLDFVVGFEVHRSNREPQCKCKLCERLVGKYPKWFKFKGWHPQCMCYCTPILADFYSKEASDDRVSRLRAALRGDSHKTYIPKALITDYPDGFKAWVSENASKQSGWATTPYFVRDNFVDGDLSKGLIYAQPKPLSLLERQRLRHEARTPEEIQAIQKRWEERRKLHELIKQEAQSILETAKDYGEVDFVALQEAVKAGDLGKMKALAKEVKKVIEEMSKMEEALADIIPDVHQWHKQFTIDELKAVHSAVEKTLNNWLKKYGYTDWDSAPLQHQKAKLRQEIHLTSSKKYAAWEVAKTVYCKKLEYVQEALDFEGFKNKLQEHQAFVDKSKTTSIKYKVGIKKLGKAIESKDKTSAQVIIAELDAKQLELKQKSQVSNLSKIVAPKSSNNTPQKGHVGSGLPRQERIEKIKELTGVKDNQEATDLMDAISSFSFQWDYEIREVQCGRVVTSRHGHALKEICRKAQIVEDFIAKSPQWEGGTTYRGMSLSQLEVENLRVQLTAGVFDNLGSASWSTKEETARMFACSKLTKKSPQFGDTKTLKVVLCASRHKKATSIKHLSKFPGEDEVLASMDCRYKLVSEIVKGDFIYFEVEPK